MQERHPRTEKSKLKAQEMAERADLIRWGGMMPYLIAELYGVSLTSIREQARNMATKEAGGPHGTHTEAQGGLGTRGEPEQTPAAGGDEATSEAAA